MGEGERALFELVGWLELGQPSMRLVLEGSRGLLTAVSVIGIGLVGTGSTVFGGHHRTLEAIGRTALAWAVLEHYEFLFHTVVHAADFFAAWMMEQGNLLGHIQRSRENMNAIWAESGEGAAGFLDRLSGIFKSGILSYSAIATQFASFLGTQLIVFLTAVFLNMLYVLGPLLVAGSVLTSGQSLKSWAASLFEIALWPAFPALVGLMGAHMTDNPAISSGNVAVVITVNLLTSFLILFTPIVVHLLMSRGGLATLAVAGNILGVRALMGLGKALMPASLSGLSQRPPGDTPLGSGGAGSPSPAAPFVGGGPLGAGWVASPRRLYGSGALDDVIDVSWNEVGAIGGARGPRLLPPSGRGVRDG